MHTNYRRTNRFRASHHNVWSWRPRSFKVEKTIKSGLRRAHERNLMAHERYDDLPRRYPQCILWEYW